MSIIPDDIKMEIVLKTRLENLQTLCSANREWSTFCKVNKKYIQRKFVETYIPDYLDPTNVIYVDGGAEYKDFSSIWKTYFIEYYHVEALEITGDFTSFMILPNMIEFEGSDIIGLKTFPIQPNMIDFRINDSQLTSFPIQPKMESFYADNNQLTSFPIQPKMTHFYAVNNQLTSFPIQPNMQSFKGNNNQLTSFPTQPEMESFYALGNPLPLESIDDQPDMFDTDIIGLETVENPYDDYKSDDYD